jgi:hypothetical protein
MKTFTIIASIDKITGFYTLPVVTTFYLKTISGDGILIPFSGKRIHTRA